MTFLWINNSHQGPFDDGTIKAMLEDGTASGDTLAWREGLDAWAPIMSVFSNETRPKSKLRLRMPQSQGVNVPEPECGPGIELLQALETTSDNVSSADLAALADSASPKPPEPMSSFYRWPQFAPDIGLCAPGEEPPNRTAANGTRMTQTEFVKILRSAVDGDVKAQFELAEIYDENAKIEPDAAVAARLQEKADEYWEVAASQRRLSTGDRRTSGEPAIPNQGVSESLVAQNEPSSVAQKGLRLRLRQEEPGPAAISLALHDVIIDPVEVCQIVCRAREGDPVAIAQLGDIYRENARQETDQTRAARFAQKADEWLYAASQGCAPAPTPQSDPRQDRSFNPN